MAILNRIEVSRNLLLEIVEQKFKDALLEATVTDKKLIAIKETILYIKLDLRLYALSTPLQLKELWEVLRGDENKVDFIMEITTELLLRGGAEEFCEVREKVTNAYGFISKVGVMDEDTFYRLPVRNNLRDLLIENPWFVTVYLLSTLKLPEDFLTPVAKESKKNGR